MDQRLVGRSGLSVSRIGLGTMTWARDTSAEEATAQLTAFAEAGGTLIDTADVYGGGDAERLIGRLIRDVVPRSELVIATKAVLMPGGERDASRRHLIRALDASLARLGLEEVDLWQLHAFDDRVPLDETLAAVDFAVSTGRTAYAGVCDYTGWQLAAAATWQRCGDARAPLVAVQAEYSLLAREPEEELIPAAAHVGAGLLAWSPLGRGVLTGKYRTGIPADSRAATPHFAEFVRPYLDERCRRIVESVTTAAEGLGVSPLAVALAWVRDRPGVSSAIVGARTHAQLLGVLQAEELTLPWEIREALDDVSDVSDP
ncbi:aldo/keto reductase [Microbispora triticiradicis]|uniref:Aldo/keto reductase n=3 Tax=Microbispora TaxID=2005 RepID=A0ABY3M285_9ACTN|nr:MULTISPECIES: aldo/keto reductase [Microbispora]RGA01483.1 aldo/keto reductase [Microbispora triticiradicis]TLP59792.1 aldo/keto reductase [Microbispora fusca]TYB63506.1 aldo/keto reductase [Microbispora tritici]GLW23252.1 oxidoreductase [Microbispora amethystogenes]